MNICKTNSNDDRPHRSRDCLCAALATLGLLVCTPRVVADCACDINVPQGTLVTIVGDLTANCMKVDGTLLIASGTVTLTGNGCATSKIDGTVILQRTAPLIFGSLAFTTNDHVLKGDGAIVGQDNVTRIQVSGGLTLTSDITIAGALQIHAGAGTFKNTGLVQADDGTANSDTLVLASGTYTGSGEWKAASADAFLRFGFAVTATKLTGDFTVSRGTLDIDADVCTTGNLTFTGGKIDVAAGKSFKAGGSCP